MTGQYIKYFNTSEVRRFVRSYKKFPCPLKKIDTVAVRIRREITNSFSRTCN